MNTGWRVLGLAVTFGAMALASPAARAGILLTNTLNGDGIPDFFAAGVTGATVSAGSTFTLDYATTAAALRHSHTGDNASLSTTRYFEFGIAVTDPLTTSLDLTSLVVRASYTGAGRAAVWVLRSSADNYTANILQWTPGADTLTESAATVTTIDLTGLANTTNITFRMYPFKSATLNYRGIVWNYGITGTLVTIPEPSALTLVGLGLLGAFVLSRRRRH